MALDSNILNATAHPQKLDVYDPMELADLDSKRQNLGAMAQQKQLRDQQIQENAMKLQAEQQVQEDQAKFADLRRQNGGSVDKALAAAPAAGINPAFIDQATKDNQAAKIQYAQMTEAARKQQAEHTDRLMGRLDAVLAAPTLEAQAAAYGQQVREGIASGDIKPGEIPDTFPGIDALKSLQPVLLGHAAYIAEADKAAQEARAVATAKREADTAKYSQLNTALDVAGKLSGFDSSSAPATTAATGQPAQIAPPTADQSVAAPPPVAAANAANTAPAPQIATQQAAATPANATLAPASTSAGNSKALFMAPGPANGLVKPGNIDLTKLPVIKNEDGSWSTVNSVSFEDEDPKSPNYGKEILVRGILNDKKVDTEDPKVMDAIRKEYYRTGKNLGVFADGDAADAYGQRLHEDWEAGKIPGVAMRESGKPAAVAPEVADASAPPSIPVPLQSRYASRRKAILDLIPESMRATVESNIPATYSAQNQKALDQIGMSEAARQAAADREGGGKPTGEFERDFLPAYAAQMNKKVADLTPAERLAAFPAFKATNADPELRASLLASRSLADAMKKITASQTPTGEDAIGAARDIINHKLAPSQVSSMFGGFGAAGQAFKRSVVREARKLNPDFDWEEAESEYQLGKSPGFQQTVKYMDYVDSSISNVIKSADALGNSKIKSINSLVNAGKKQFNNVDLAKFNTDRLEVSDAIAKILQGGGTGSGTSDAKLKEAQGLIKETDDPAVVRATAGEIQSLIGNRRKTLTKGTFMEGPKSSSETYVRYAVGAGGHKIGQKSDGGWYDTETGKKVQ